MYRITIVYTTGDSESTYERESELGVWENIEVVKENLKRLQEYVKWSRNRSWYGHKKDVDLTPPECVVASDKYGYQPSIELKADNGEKFQITPFWDDTFSSFIEARVELALGFRSEDLDLD